MTSLKEVIRDSIRIYSPTHENLEDRVYSAVKGYILVQFIEGFKSLDSTVSFTTNYFFKKVFPEGQSDNQKEIQHDNVI